MKDYTENEEDKLLSRIIKLEDIIKARSLNYQKLMKENIELLKQRDELELIISQMRFYFKDQPFYDIAEKKGWF